MLTKTATLLLWVPAVMVKRSFAETKPSIKTWLREVTVMSPPTSGADTLPRNQMLPSLLSTMLPSPPAWDSLHTAVVSSNLPVGSETMALARDMSTPTPRLSPAACMLMRPVARNEPPTLVLPNTRPAEAWMSKLANLPLQLKVAAAGSNVAPAITAPKICTLAPEIKAVLLLAMVES